MTKFTFLAPALVSLLTACAGGGVPSDSGWREVDSPHFHVLTNLGSGEARETAETFERFRQAILAWYGGELDPPATVTAIVYSGRSVFRARGADKVAGFWVPSSGGRLLVSCHDSWTFDGMGLPEVDAHELAHELNAYFLLRQPRWLGEGLANYLSTVRVEKGRARVGYPSQEWLWWLRDHRPLPLPNLWAWDTEAYDKLSLEELWARYFSSALWVHFLENERGVRFDDFKRRLGRGEPPRDAWDAAFANLDEATLYGELEAYLRRVFPVRQLTLGDTAVPLKERALSKAEVAVIQAEAWMQGPGTEPPAERNAWIRGKIAEAVALKPDYFFARYLELQLAPSAERLKKAEALTRLAPSEGRAWHVYAALLPKDDARAVPAFEKAVALAPQNSVILEDAAHAEARAGHPEAALEDAKKAVALAPWDASAVDSEAVANWAAGHCDQAVADESRAIDLLIDGPDGRLRERLSAQLERIRAECGHAPAPASKTEAKPR